MRRRVLAAATLAAAASAPAFAGGLGGPETTPAPAEVTSFPAPDAGTGWSFSVMPYIWASGMTGTIRPFGSAPTFEIDRSIADTFDSVDSAAFLSFGAERGRFFILGDVSRVASSQEGTLPGGIPAEGRLTQTTLTFGAGYRALPRATGFVDVFAGFRAFDLEAEVAAAGGALSASPSLSIVDPIVGVRIARAFSPRLSAALVADVGGFGVGNEFAAVATGLLNWRVGDSTTISGGWRQMWIDYDDGSTLADVTLGGPVLGVSFRF